MTGSIICQKFSVICALKHGYLVGMTDFYGTVALIPFFIICSSNACCTFTFMLILIYNFEGRNPNLADKTTRFIKKLNQLDLDGLPFVGAYIEQGDALYR